MKFCQPHWDSLREKVRAAGLYPYVATSGEAVAKKMVAELEGGAPQFDPLMGAHNQILSFTLGQFGLAIMMGETCPVCYANEACREHLARGGTADFLDYEWMLDRAVQDQLEEAKRLGLATMTPTAQPLANEVSDKHPAPPSSGSAG